MDIKMRLPPTLKLGLHMEFIVGRGDPSVRLTIDGKLDMCLTRDISMGRWRWHYLISKSCIAKAIFDYPNNPTEGEIAYMESYVAALARVLEVAAESRKKAIAEAKEHMEWLSRVPKSFFPEPVVATEEPDHLYLMEHTNGLVKIGRSKNPKAREKTLQAEDPRLHLSFIGKCCGHYEKSIQKVFREVRSRGEWFALEDNHKDWIATFCNLANGSLAAS
jgi:hypothetical protein